VCRIWCVACGKRLTRIRRNYCVLKGVFSEPNLPELEGENVRIGGHSGGDFTRREWTEQSQVRYGQFPLLITVIIRNLLAHQSHPTRMIYIEISDQPRHLLLWSHATVTIRTNFGVFGPSPPKLGLVPERELANCMNSFNVAAVRIGRWG